MYCSKCGQPVGNNELFCPSCGTSVSNQTENPFLQNQTANKNAVHSKKVAAVIIVLGLALFGILYTIIFSDGIISYSSADAVVEACADALTEANAEKLLHLCFTKDCYEKLSSETIQSFQSTLDLANTLVKGITNSEAEYEMSISFKFKLDSDEMQEITDYYQYNYNVDVPVLEGYSSDVKMKVNGSKETVNLVLFRTKNEGWKLTPDSIRKLLGMGMG